jgi:hypothetical protein
MLAWLAAYDAPASFQKSGDPKEISTVDRERDRRTIDLVERSNSQSEQGPLIREGHINGLSTPEVWRMGKARFEI